jgi:hypothetical protein
LEEEVGSAERRVAYPGRLNADDRLSDLMYDSLFVAVTIRLRGSLVAVGFS